MSNSEMIDEGQTVGRPVRVVSICFPAGSKGLQDVAGIIDAEAARGADLIALPETWRGQNDTTPEGLSGETVTVLSALAKKHGTYIISPMDRLDGRRRLNTAVLIDRDGQVAGHYDKAFVYWGEFELARPVSPGGDAPVFGTDFGRLGIAICFDVNFPEVWRRLADQGAELVVWCSAYSAGASLQAHAINHHYYIVSATSTCDCQVYDITGERIVDKSGENLNVVRVRLDLDRGIYHENFNMSRLDRLLAERGDDVMRERRLEREQWFVLRARRPGVSARRLAREYGLEELRDYIGRSRCRLDEIRGRPFGPLPAGRCDQPRP